jgi:hypothetical protein
LVAADGEPFYRVIEIKSYHDPLHACVDAVLTTGLENRWLVRRLPALVRAAGFEVRPFHSYGYVQTEDPAYMQNLVERGADPDSARLAARSGVYSARLRLNPGITAYTSRNCVTSYNSATRRPSRKRCAACSNSNTSKPPAEVGTVFWTCSFEAGFLNRSD